MKLKSSTKQTNILISCVSMNFTRNNYRFYHRVNFYVSRA